MAFKRKGRENMKTPEEIKAMTPLERAQYKESLPQCTNCGNCVEVGGRYYCKTNGKMLIPSYMEIGRCMHVPSLFVKRGE